MIWYVINWSVRTYTIEVKLYAFGQNNCICDILNIVGIWLEYGWNNPTNFQVSSCWYDSKVFICLASMLCSISFGMFIMHASVIHRHFIFIVYSWWNCTYVQCVIMRCLLLVVYCSLVVIVCDANLRNTLYVGCVPSPCSVCRSGDSSPSYS